MKQPPPKTKIYADLMQEVKDRLDVIGLSVGAIAKGTSVHPFAVAELGFLQLRYICELIALAACVAHEPAKLTSRILKSWNAEATFGLLNKLNEHCFPVAVTLTEPEDGSLHFEGVRDALNFETLKDIYSRCGDTLHRGPVKRLLKLQERVYNIDELHNWAALIGRSLATHAILIPEQGAMMVVYLAAGPDRKVEVFEAQSVDGQPFTVKKGGE